MNPSVPRIDAARLERLYDRVLAVLSDGHEHTLSELADLCIGGEASISARLRELRADGHNIQKRRASKGSGLYLYRLLRPLPAPAQLDLGVPCP